jgi:hypothetical protein
MELSQTDKFGQWSNVLVNDGEIKKKYLAGFSYHTHQRCYIREINIYTNYEYMKSKTSNQYHFPSHLYILLMLTISE